MARIGLMDITERIERGGVTVRIKKVLSPTSFRPGADRSNRAISILSTVAGAYALVLPYAALIAMALFALSVIEAVWRRRLAPLVFVNTILFVTMATTMMHALTTRAVDIVLTVLLLIGSVTGAQVGAQFAQKAKPEQLRLILAVIVLGVAIRMALGLGYRPDEIYTVVTQ